MDAPWPTSRAKASLPQACGVMWATRRMAPVHRQAGGPGCQPLQCYRPDRGRVPRHRQSRPWGLIAGAGNAIVIDLIPRVL